MKCNKQLKHSNYVAFSHFHRTTVNNSGIIIEISENNGNFQTEYIERITEICRQYYAFCDETFPEDERFPDTSPFQHKGNEKAEGQMHFTDKNFTWHIEESGHFCGWLSYKDLYELFSEDTE